MIANFDSKQAIQRLQALQAALAIAYASSLPLSMTASWSILIAGLICFALELTLQRSSFFSAASRSAPNRSDRSVTGQSGTGSAYALSLPISLFVMAVALSGVFNGGLAEAWRSVWSLKALAIYFWASHLFFRDRKLALTCVSTILIMGAIAGVWGTIQQVFNFHPFGYRWLQGTGFLGGPMAFAGQMQALSMLAVAISIAGAYRGFRLQLNNKWLFLALTTANLAGLIFAGERGAWLGGLFGLLSIAALFSWRTLAKFSVVLLLICVLSWFTVPLVHTRIESMISGKKDVSTRVRFQVWQQALDCWHSSPIVGIGLLKFPHLDIPEAIVPGRSKDINHAHSNYLQILCTTGLVGLSAFAWLCLAVLVQARKNFIAGKLANDAISMALGAGVFGAMISLMVSGLFEYNFGTAQVRLLQWFVLALLAVPMSAVSGSASKTPSISGGEVNDLGVGIDVDGVASKE